MVKKPFTHRDPQDVSDEQLAQEARAQLAKSPHLQFVAELLAKLRELGFAWFTPEHARAVWPTAARMRWLAQRADVRQRITTQLTGLPPNTARKKSLEFQVELIDAVVEDGDVDVRAFDVAFDPCDLAVYGPADELWAQFRDRMPWEDDSPAHQKLVAWAIRQLLSERSAFEGLTRKPILTAWDVRTSIDSRLWQSRMPLEVRVAVDDARLRHEKARPRDPFHARHDLAIAVPEQIVANIPLRELTLIFAAAERAMGIAIGRSDDDSKYDPPATFDEDWKSGDASAAPPSEARRTSPVAALSGVVSAGSGTHKIDIPSIGVKERLTG
jgi:hypothetical protein